MADLMCTRLEAGEKDDRGKTAQASAVRQWERPPFPGLVTVRLRKHQVKQ